MAWAKVDDKLHASVKWRRATKGARALWTTALSWCSDYGNDGRVPADMLGYLDGTRTDAASLVSAGLWDETDEGWVFHDWADYNPDGASTQARRVARSEAAHRTNHERWHVKRHVTVAGCDYCESLERSVSDQSSDSVSESLANPPVPVPVPVPKEKKTSSSSETRKRATELPHDWRPTPEHQERAATSGLDLGREVMRFRTHAEEKGRTAKNWNAAFTRWLINAEDYAERDGRRPTTQPALSPWDRQYAKGPE